ncbi:hypothetical protein [Mesorhizobium xinjiangense]|uniref:hypothetical protein n=1 Tax=Mesorhizobium xinjiangense TaxID=2678685 RepID=UPI0012ED3366|nr:hypothetical protein [Mesorhizobium xinjiangense]
MNPFYRGLLGRIDGQRARWRALRDEIRTERILNELPAHIRKDIGWPDARGGRLDGRRRSQWSL